MDLSERRGSGGGRGNGVRRRGQRSGTVRESEGEEGKEQERVREVRGISVAHQEEPGRRGSRRWLRSVARSPHTCFSFWQKVEEAGSAGWAGPANWAARRPGQVSYQVQCPLPPVFELVFVFLFCIFV